MRGHTGEMCPSVCRPVCTPSCLAGWLSHFFCLPAVFRPGCTGERMTASAPRRRRNTRTIRFFLCQKPAVRSLASSTTPALSGTRCVTLLLLLLLLLQWWSWWWWWWCREEKFALQVQLSARTSSHSPHTMHALVRLRFQPTLATTATTTTTGARVPGEEPRHAARRPEGPHAHVLVALCERSPRRLGGIQQRAQGIR